MPPRRSILQRAQSLLNIGAVNTRKNAKIRQVGAQEQENVPPNMEHQTAPTATTSAIALLQRELVGRTEKLTQLVKKLRNRTKEAKRAKERRSIIQEDLKRLKHSSNMQKKRLPKQKERAVEKAVSQRQTKYLKENGIVSDEGRQMVRNLSIEGRVPNSQINHVIRAVGVWLGIDVCDEISERTVGRIVEEGGIASQVQVVDEIEQERAFTVSGDGTTIRHLNYEAKHITLNAPSYENGEGGAKTPKTRFVGVTSGINHKSETQLKGWKDLNDNFYATYNTIFKAEGKEANPITFATYMLGNGSDHSEDQKKLNRLLLEWKTLCDRLLRGKEAIRTMVLEDLIHVLWEESVRKVADAGGLEAWDKLSEAEKDDRDRAAYEQLCEKLGEEAWMKVPEETRLEAMLFIWAGCGMHKEMNATKGGAERMQEYWSKNGLTPPIKLFNRDNAAAAASGPSSAHDRAVEVSQGGAVKVASLAGLLFNHKDDKKGLQDTYRNYFLQKLGYTVHFPDTCNTRFQMHLQGAAELLVHLPLYLDLLLEVKDNKEKGNFNHLEYNIYKALQDIPTLTEMAALTLYLLAISYPYMRVVRGGGECAVNAIELGPFHEQVKLHCQNVINNPDLLLAPDATFTLGALDSKLWERPEAFYTVKRMASTLPHLRGVLVSFFEGALETWQRFTTEYTHGGAIDRLTDDQKEKVFICATNDRNEGALGSLRKAFWRSSTLSLRRHNAGMMYKRNGTSGYVNNVMTKDQRSRLKQEARHQQKQFPEARRRREQAAHNAQKAMEKRRKCAERQGRLAQAESILDNLQLELDVKTLERGLKSNKAKITVSEMKAQLDWHRRRDTEKKIPIKACINKMKKDDVLIQLIVAVKRYHQNPSPIPEHLPAADDPDLELVSREMDWEEAEDLQDAEMNEDVPLEN